MIIVTSTLWYILSVLVGFLSATIGWRIVEHLPMNRWEEEDWKAIIIISIISPLGLIAAVFWWWQLIKHYVKKFQ